MLMTWAIHLYLTEKYTVLLHVPPRLYLGLVTLFVCEMYLEPFCIPNCLFVRTDPIGSFAMEAEAAWYGGRRS